MEAVPAVVERIVCACSGCVVVCLLVDNAQTLLSLGVVGVG